MPSHCCVTNCRGNYNNGPKVSIFKFPEQPELRKAWIKAIPRKDFKPSSSSRVCERHFIEADIQRTEEIFDENTGKKISATLGHPRLVTGAVPKIFPDCPPYLSSNRNIRRESMDAKKMRIENKALTEAILASLKSKDARDFKLVNLMMHM